MGYDHEELLNVSIWTLAVAALPLLAIAAISWYFGLGIGSPILIGTVRALIQLSVLGMILDPIFERGRDFWGLVVLYVLFMITLASYESSARSKYYFKDMSWYVMGMLLINVTIVSMFAFGVILKLDPLWDPQYVIPIIGMLLGNCINGVSLTLNSMLTSVVESSREIELMLSFGASTYEASSRLVKEAIRTGAMPSLNSMAIIGIISIPGMMTGQILGGTTVTQAARYQILITYLIATCSFGTILSQTLFTVRICFDSRKMLRSDRLFKRDGRKALLSAVLSSIFGRIFAAPNEKVAYSAEEISSLSSRGELVVRESHEGQSNSKTAVIEVSGLSYAFKKSETTATGHGRRILFQDIGFRLGRGEKALVDGPSGVGKSTLLRTLAGLAPVWEGEILLHGKPQAGYEDMAIWRKKVLYVPQTKVDVPGTPMSLLNIIHSFKAWKNSDVKAPSLAQMTEDVEDLVYQWEVAPKLLASEWRILSGGECQRILLAIALASQPVVVLLDESTSALDLGTKVKVESSIEDYCKRNGMVAIWITHDHVQQGRINRNESKEAIVTNSSLL